MRRWFSEPLSRGDVVVLIITFVGIPILMLTMLGMLLFGCGGSERQACYARAEAAAWTDAEASCFADFVQWDACEHRARIVAELERAYRRCP